MSRRILLVDDENDILELVTPMLENSGYEVLTAADGQEAIEKARLQKPDLIILDLMLPKLDGYSVCRMIKLDKTIKNIPIIMFTARAGKDDQSTASEVGADAYIIKPFDPEAMLSKIKELLAEK